jgi:hypothetical protein
MPGTFQHYFSAPFRQAAFLGGTQVAALIYCLGDRKAAGRG